MNLAYLANWCITDFLSTESLHTQTVHSHSHSKNLVFNQANVHIFGLLEETGVAAKKNKKPNSGSKRTLNC